FSNAVLAVEATLAGQGVALAAQPLVAAHLAAGNLVVAHGLALPSPCHYHLVGHPAQAQRPAVVAFRQWLVAQAAAASAPAARSSPPQGLDQPGGHR
ncbi:MAG: LysR family transcriptional regulator, partial [Burkholderiales bacterium PBB5]